MTFLKEFFRKKSKDIEGPPPPPPKKNRCFVCDENNPVVKSAIVMVGGLTAGYGRYDTLYYHKECVERLVCNADKLSTTYNHKLMQAVRLVRQWEKDAIEQKAADLEFQKRLAESKAFLCDKQKD